MGNVKHKNRGRTELSAIADRLHSVCIHLLRRVRKQDSDSGIGPAQLSALSVLVFAGPRSLGQLASAEQVKPPTMSRIVEGLRRGRLIEIQRDSHDARRMVIGATPHGTRLLQEGRRRRIEYLAAHMRDLTSDETSQIASAVAVLEKLLNQWP